jgi:UDP-N-acetylmuramate--alanine ligase
MYNKKTHIHFVGIGGIGMSGLATILHYEGYTISGCDLDFDQQTITNLKKIGCTIYHGNNTAGCYSDTIDVLVYSSAIQPTNPEVSAARMRGIPTIPRAIMLAEIMRTRYSIAISGAHGKTTTTSLIAHILFEAHVDPTVIIGGHLKSLSTNAYLGTGNFIVVETDESDRSFLHLHATLGVVTNINLEHLETYHDIDDIKQSFLQFLSNIPFYGKAILCADDPHIQSLLPIHHIRTVFYGIDLPADIYATDVSLQADFSTFTIHHKKQNLTLGNALLSIPGKHNVLNALAAVAVAHELSIPTKKIIAALATFKGVERRFSYCGTFKGTPIYDDYGHHPREIYNTLLVARKKTHGKVVIIFQPHRYTRTDKLWDEFISMFMETAPDHLIITDIYPASEIPIPGITSEAFTADLVAKNPSFPAFYYPLDDLRNGIREILKTIIQSDDLILFQGAGVLYKIAHSLAEQN